MINELLATISDGAKSNRYRITIPDISGVGAKALDIVVQATSLPSHTITPAEIMVRGRKVQLRGETNLENTWDITFYNTSDMIGRQLFIDWMTAIHKNQWTLSSGGVAGNISSGISQGISAIKDIKQGISKLMDNPLDIFNKGIITYQKDIIIEQLDPNGEAKFKCYLIGAFPINVGNVEYDDTNPEISKTTVTFAFTDIVTESSSDSINLGDLETLFSF